MTDELRERLRQLEERAKRAVGGYTASYRRLFAHGEQLLDDDRHAAAVRRLRSERNAELSRIYAEIRAVRSEAREAVELAGEFARDSILSASERSEVSARRAFAGEEIERLDGEAMSRRLRGVLRTGSKVEMFLAWEAASRKRAGIAAPVLDWDSDLDSLDRSLFEATYQERVAPAAELLDEAERIAQFAYCQRDNADSIAAAIRNRSSGVVASIFPRVAPGTAPSGGRGGVADDGSGQGDQGDREGNLAS